MYVLKNSKVFLLYKRITMFNFIYLGDSIDRCKEPLLSDLKEDYNFVQELESKLEGASITNIKDLLFTFELSYEDRCKILKCTAPSMAFFENLSKTKPQLSLRGLKETIEQIPAETIQPNMTIFRKIDEDIAKISVSFTLDSTLEELSAAPNDWLYILETIAGNLISESGTFLTSWENIASVHGYSTSEINNFRRANTDLEERPLQKFLFLLCARNPTFSVSLFVDKLRQIG